MGERIRHTLAFISLFATSIFCVVVLLSTRKQEAVNLSTYVPSTADFVIEIKPEELINSGLHTLLSTRENLDLIGKTLNYSKDHPSEKKTKPMGINFRNPAVVYGDEIDGNELTVYIFHVLNSDLFIKNASNQLGIDGKALVDGELGYLITGEISNDNAVKYVGSLESKTKNTSNATPYNLLHLFKKNPHPLIRSLDLKANSDATSLSGFVDIEMHEKVSIAAMNERLAPDGIHLTTNYLPKQWKDSIGQLLELWGLPPLVLEGFSMNYRGIEILSTKNGFTPCPDMDLLIYSNEKLNPDAILRAIQEKNYFDKSNTLKDLVIGNQHYRIELQENKLILSSRAIIKLIPNQKNFIMQGNLANLSQINGGGFFSEMIRMSPYFQFTNTFFQDIDEFEMYSSELNPQSMKLQFKFQFKPNVSPASALYKANLARMMAQ